MAYFRINGQLNVVFEEVEIEANSKEEALEKLYKMSVQEIIDDCYIKDSEIVEEEVTLQSAKLHFKVSNIDWEITEDDLNDVDEDDLRAYGPEPYIKETIETLPKEYFFSVYCDSDTDIDEIEEDLRDQLSDESGFLFNDFLYEIEPSEAELFEEIKRTR